MINDLRLKNKKVKLSGPVCTVSCLLLFGLWSLVSFSQVTSSIDSTKIKIGAQITYKISVNADANTFVVFPEGQTFSPLEMIDSYPIDTIKNKDKFNL